MYKCLKCNKLSRDPDIDCETPTDCNVLECVAICYASISGIGMAVGASQIKVTNEDKTTKVVTESIRLHCMCTIPNTPHTTALHAVTCLNCLASLKKD